MNSRMDLTYIRDGTIKRPECCPIYVILISHARVDYHPIEYHGEHFRGHRSYSDYDAGQRAKLSEMYHRHMQHLIRTEQLLTLSTRCTPVSQWLVAWIWSFSCKTQRRKLAFSWDAFKCIQSNRLHVFFITCPMRREMPSMGFKKSASDRRFLNATI
jgi:hypothetical protein